MKRNFKIKLQLNDAQVAELRDAGSKLKKVKVRIEATHSGIINQNKFFYTPQGMSDGAHTFVEPFNKPVMLNHDRDLDPIGRVLESKYVDYDDLDNSTMLTDAVRTGTNPQDMVDLVADFVQSSVFLDENYKGLGHIELIAEISDHDAIEKVLDERYLTVSIGGRVDSAACSICGSNKLADQSCDHLRGETYDGEECFYIGGVMDFDEVSYVNSPADKKAVGTVISDSADDTFFSEQSFEILDFELDDAGEDKLNLKDLLAKLADQNLVAETLEQLGLSSLALSDERYAKLRKTSFLFADEKFLPVNDKAHIVAAYSILDQVEDSEEKAQVMSVLDKKFATHFGKEVSLEDATAELKASVKTEDLKNEEVDTDVKEAIVDTVAIAAEVTKQVTAALKDSFTVSDSYLAQRNDALEAEVNSLEKEIEELTDLYRSSIINQILSFEDKIEDEDYKAKLAKRSLDSLHDKLEDLGVFASKANVQDEDENQDDAEALQDNEEIEQTDVNVEDAADESGEIENNGKVQDDADEGNILDVATVETEYRRLQREKGFVAASKYLKDLKEEGKLPATFTFSKRR